MGLGQTQHVNMESGLVKPQAARASVRQSTSSAILRFRRGRQPLHFLAQLRLDLVQVRVGQRLMPAGVGLDLHPIERDIAQLEQLQLPRQQQHLHEQPFQFGQEPAPERGQRVMVGMRVGREVPEWD